MEDGDKPVELSDILGKCECNNMVWVLINNYDGSNFGELGWKPAARADKQTR